MHLLFRRAAAFLLFSAVGLVSAGGGGVPPRVDAFALYDAAALLLRTHYAGHNMGKIDDLLTQQRIALLQACAGQGQGRCPEDVGRTALERVISALGDWHTGTMWNGTVESGTDLQPLDPRSKPVMDWKGTVAVIRFPNGFDAGVGAAFYSAVQQAQAQGVTGLVVDLRENPGGRGDECLSAPQVLAGNRVSLVGVGRSGARIFDWQRSPQAQVARGWKAWTGPLALLVSANTASCGEILAYWGQQAGGTVIGLPTFGLLNTRSGRFALPGPSVLAIADMRNTVDGRVPYPLRVQPDIKAQVVLADILAVRDPVMEAALQVLRR